MAVTALVALALTACASEEAGGPGAGDGGTSVPPAACSDACCLGLLTCCRSILVNPVFFESCNQVVNECNRDRCAQVVAGYPTCAPLFMDGGVEGDVCPGL